MKTKSQGLPYDSTYFTMSDVAPRYDADTDTLTIFNGEGSRRSWGRPQVTSTVVFRGRSLIAIHVGFSHKHRGGQGWHYFRRDDGGWTKVTWGQLSDPDRKKVLGRKDRAPGWAKSPGMLRKKTVASQFAYKLVKVEGEKMVSLYDGTTEYSIGKLLTQKARNFHQGGYYSYATPEQVTATLESGRLVPEECLHGVERLALIKCEIGGKIINYAGRKMASTHLRPVEVVEIFDVASVS